MQGWETVFWIVIGVVLLCIAICEYYFCKTGVPTVTSFPAARRKMIALLVEEATKQQQAGKPFTIIDMGSGNGKLAQEIARALPHSHVVGFEISIVPYFLSLLRLWIGRDKNLSFLRQDFWAAEIGHADAVVVFMAEKIRDKMAQKLKADLKPGTFVVVNEIYLPGWTPQAEFTEGLFKLKVIAYRKP